MHERRGRVVPLAPWLVAYLATLGRREGRIIGESRNAAACSRAIGKLWRKTDAPPALYEQRPDHAFRIGLVSELTRSRVDREAVEHYVGHAPGIRGHYVDASALPLSEVAAAIPCVRAASTSVVVSLDRRPIKRVAG